MHHLLILITCPFLIPIDPAHADDAPSFELLDGDRVVFIGNTFIERDQVYGYLETMLTARWPDRNITFRNLGWSGDTVWGEARARFGTAADGFQHLKEHVEAIKPTVVFVGYGTNESFEGEPGLTRFEKGLIALLEMLTAASAPNARCALLSPIRQENVGAPAPDLGERNAALRMYSDLIRRVAAARDHDFIGLYDMIPEQRRSPVDRRLTDNGVHLNEFGYWTAADVITRSLGCSIRHRNTAISIGPDGIEPPNSGVALHNFEKTQSGCRFDLVADMLLPPRQPRETSRGRNISRPIFSRFANIAGLEPGMYEISRDGMPLTKTRSGQIMQVPADGRPTEQLRQAIIEKNRLYFHRWRPQNETYLFGFRKHEQGQNAAEVPKFDPLVEELEAKIAKLRVPVKHTYELIRQE